MNPCNKGLYLTHVLFALAVGLVLGSCQLQQASPAARYGARMIFDPVGNRAVLFGGRAEGLFGLKYFDDLWAFDVPSQKWMPLRTDRRPGERLSPGLVYDPDHHQIILFGGHNDRGRFGDTWIYKFTDQQWQEVTPPTSPPPRSDAGMAYDETNHRVILFSGYCQEGNSDLCGDTWSFDPETFTWTEMKPTISPPMMYGHTLVYDPAKRRSMLWGGHMYAVRDGAIASIGYGNNIWSYDFSENRWEQIEAANINNPAARYWHQSTFDTTNAQLFLFGGDGGHGFLNDTWRFNVINNTWEKVTPKAAPRPRVNAAISYDPMGENVILFGGLGEDRTDFGDTWVFRGAETGGKWVNVSP